MTEEVGLCCRDFRSADGERIYHVSAEATGFSCTCPGFRHRGSCAHVSAAQRYREWGQPFSEKVLPPPAAWTKTLEEGGE